MNEATGYIPAGNNGPYPAGGTYTTLGSAFPLYYYDPASSQGYHGFIEPVIPFGI